MTWMGDSGVVSWAGMALWMLVLWSVVTGVVVWVVRSSRSERRRSADDVLAERFARGDIPADEYERGRELLHSGSRRPQS